MFRIFIFLLLISIQSWAQSSSARQVTARINEEKWEKAEQIIGKSLRKDSSNVEMKYLASLLFANKNYPRFNVDSAHQYIVFAQRSFSTLPVRDKEKLKNLPLDSNLLIIQKGHIDSLAFEIARSINTEEGYIHFVKNYGSANQLPAAIKLRDEAAYSNAIKINSQEGYKEFLAKYPHSILAHEIQEKYSKLLFEESTKEGRLKNYEDFIFKNPESPYRSMAEQRIFEISTAGGSIEAFSHFIKTYPQSKSAKRAKDLLFYLSENYLTTFKAFVSDSLRETIELNKSYWVPFLKSGKYGFMNSAGTEKIAPTYDEIPSDYLCGDIRLDYFVTSAGIISRKEQVIFDGVVKEVSDLGDGFLKIKTASATLILHKSGFTIHPKVITDTRILANRFLLVKEENRWGIISFSGLPLLPPVYEDISSFDDWIILTRNGKKIVVTADQVGAIADQIPLPQELVFDDVKRWATGLCWVRNDALEGVINESLEFIIPLDRQVLSKTPFGFLKKKGTEFFIEGVKDLEEKSFDKIVLQGQWMMISQKNEVQLFDSYSGKKITDNPDSIWFEKNIALVKKRDSIHAWLNNKTHLDFNINAKTTLFGRDSSAWIVADEKSKKSVYDALTGKRLFIAEFDKIESPALDCFLITKGNKKGLLDKAGKPLLAVAYDAIIQSEPGRFSLLKDKKFGLFDLATKKLIKPLYERNIIPYNKEWFVAFKETGWGFIQADMKSAGNFQFNEIQYWNDTVAWVKENFQWKLIHFKTNTVVFDKIKDFKYISKYPHEYVAIIHQDNYYGVISNRRGLIIPATFTDIVNLGDAETPMYFTEKHVEEADIYVVIYYDNHGKSIRKQAFEADEYERIFCEEN
jgi:hypothetical protein